MRASLVPLLFVLTASSAAGQTQASPPEPMNPTQEVAGEKPSGPAILAGPTEIRIGGYLGLTGIYRSTASGGGPGTSFASIPYSDTVTGNVSEARLTARRIAMWVPQRHFSPVKASLISPSDGFFFVSRNAAAVMIQPLMQ